MAMVAMGPLEMLMILLMSAAGQPADLVSMLPPQDYFKTRGIEVSADKMVELAAKDPVDAPTQLAQLLALRILGEDGRFKKAANYETQRKVIEEIASARKAQDKLGFAKEYAQRALARLDGTKPPLLGQLGVRAEGLSWFPAAATFVGSIESRPSAELGAPDKTVNELLQKMPPEFKKELYKVAESLGNVQIQRVTAAYVDEGNDKGRNFVRMTGRVSHAWVRGYLKDKGVEVEERHDARGTKISLLLAEGARRPQIALIGDHDILIAGFSRWGAKDQDVLEQALSVREKKQANAATCALKEALEKIPTDAVGFLAGEFPEDFRRDLGRTFGVFPKKVAAHLDRAKAGFNLVVQAGLEDEEQAKIFVKAASKVRMDGLETLKMAPEIPVQGANLGELKNVLNSLQLEAKGANVNVRMLLSDEALRMLPSLMMFGSSGAGSAPPTVKKDN